MANISQEDKTIKSLPHEKERLSKSSANHEIEVNEQEIEENYSKVSLELLKKEDTYIIIVL